MQNPLISLQHISKTYDEGRIVALSELSLDVFAGEWLTIIGRSGSGKSTLLNILAGLDSPSSGNVIFDGESNPSKRQWNRLRATSIGFVFQSFNLLPTLTAIENVEIPMFETCTKRVERITKAANLLNHVGLNDRCNHYPPLLSGGERQRVAIARSLANDPSILIADEPTGNLDSTTTEEILTLLRHIHHTRDLTIIMVTHENDIASLGNRTIYLEDGRIVRS